MLVDFVVVVAITTAIGVWAPHWPDRWLDPAAFHVPFLPWETPAFYRRIGVATLARRMPEAGALFGGESKSSLPGTTPADLQRYYIEVSRAEWVHIGSSLSPLVLFLFSPVPAVIFWLVFVAGANALFLAILRNNRLRITAILSRLDARP